VLAIRLRRTGRRNHAQYRVIVQDSRRHPKRGNVVAYVGTYDPHAKTAVLDKDSIKEFLKNGAQPSDSTARLLKKEGIKLPAWVKIEKQPKRKTRHPEKLRKNQPKDAKPAAKPIEEAPAESTAEETAGAEGTKDETKTEEAAAEEVKPEAEPKAEPSTEQSSGAEEKPEVAKDEKPKEASKTPEEAKS